MYVGSSLVEPLQETYFFKKVKKERDRNRFFGIYNIADPVANSITPLIASFVLALSIGFRELWLFSFIILIGFTLICLTIKEK